MTRRLDLARLFGNSVPVGNLCPIFSRLTLLVRKKESFTNALPVHDEEKQKIEHHSTVQLLLRLPVQICLHSEWCGMEWCFIA